MIEFLTSATHAKDYPESSREIVIVGRSNVGKSSFINALYKQKVAYVGKTAGKTRLLNFFNINDEYTMLDVPGYSFAKVSNKMLMEFARMMDEYFASRECLKLMVQIVDIRHKPTHDDLDMMEFARENHIKVIVIANKADKLSRNKQINGAKLIAETLNVNKEDVIIFSSVKPTNRQEVLDRIKSAIM